MRKDVLGLMAEESVMSCLGCSGPVAGQYIKYTAEQDHFHCEPGSKRREGERGFLRSLSADPSYNFYCLPKGQAINTLVLWVTFRIRTIAEISAHSGISSFLCKKIHYLLITLGHTCEFPFWDKAPELQGKMASSGVTNLANEREIIRKARGVRSVRITLLGRY